MLAFPMRSSIGSGKDLRLLGLGALGFLCCVLLTIWSNRRYSELGWQGDDFPEFYAAGRLAGTGHLYDSAAMVEIESRYRRDKFTLPYLRLPSEAWLLRSIARFPYSISRAIWYGITGAAVVLAICLWPLAGAGRKAVIAGWFFPVANCIVCGQDAVFLVLFTALAARWLTGKREWLAGLALGCCFYKFHLGIGIAVILLASLRWRAIGGAALSAAGQIAASFVVEPGWLPQYIRALGAPGADGGVVIMPNLRGLCNWLPHYASAAQIILAAVILAALWRATRTRKAPVSLALALAAGVLVSPHAFVYDWVVVLPLVTLVGGGWRADLRWLAAQLRFPPLYELPYLVNLSTLAFALTQIIAVGALSTIIIGAGFEPGSGRSEAPSDQ